jgi:hypothetical protein
MAKRANALRMAALARKTAAGDPEPAAVPEVQPADERAKVRRRVRHIAVGG